jgi:hypothetical protein
MSGMKVSERKAIRTKQKRPKGRFFVGCGDVKDGAKLRESEVS